MPEYRLGADCVRPLRSDLAGTGVLCGAGRACGLFEDQRGLGPFQGRRSKTRLPLATFVRPYRGEEPLSRFLITPSSLVRK